MILNCQRLAATFHLCSYCCGGSHLSTPARHMFTARRSALFLAATHCSSSTSSSTAASCSTRCYLCLLLAAGWELAPHH
jgi:hypothetical protein